MKTCLKIVGVRADLQPLEGRLQPTQIPPCSAFPSWEEFSHTGWQAFSLVFFPSSATTAVSLSVEGTTNWDYIQRGGGDNGAEKKSSTAINWLSYSPMVTRSHRWHKTRSVFSLGLVLLCLGPSGLLPRHVCACVGVQVWPHRAIPVSKFKMSRSPDATLCSRQKHPGPNPVPPYDTCLYHCTQVFVTHFEEVSEAPWCSQWCSSPCFICQRCSVLLC